MIHNTSSLNGACVDCGATREEVVDNIYPVCLRFQGPNRIALIAINKDRMWRERDLSQLRASLRLMEESVVRTANAIRDKQADIRELEVSIERLKNT
jgi:hypothetical protein